jgi:signal transduction histidine kinase
MTFRTRLTIAFSAIILVSLSMLAAGARREVRSQLTTQYERRGEALAVGIRRSVEAASASIGTRLDALAAGIGENNDLRSALLGRSDDRSDLLAYAEHAMRLAELSMLQIRNDSNRILSSGHFRNEFDRVDPRLIDALRGAPDGLVLAATPTPSGNVRMLVRADSVRVGSRWYTVIGGLRADDVLFSGATSSGELTVAVTIDGAVVASSADSSSAPASVPGGDGLTIARIAIPYLGVSDNVPTMAAIVVVHSLEALGALQRRLDRWAAAVMIATLLGCVLLAWWLSARLARPLTDLAQAASRVDLDRFDVGFATRREDEIGILSRRLQSMVERLRGSAAQLRDAERRATVGDIARQVNHDIKNGLAPIRNVVRHLAQAARESPGELPGVFAARQGTLESSISYLETLAQNYAKLTPRHDGVSCDVNAVVEEVARTAGARGASVEVKSAPGLAPAAADALVLRRILENLVGNAIDSVEGRGGGVTVTTGHSQGAAPAGSAVRISVIDAGRGMTEPELAKAFDDFYTTKPDGTGLGLSVVRRLVADLGGVLRIETEPGKGTRVTVDLPAKGQAVPAVRPEPAPARVHG